ncbi:MAG: NYN domain-containing protein [bacterium]|nr:NYN domain-containing protein [bacterium]
MINIIDANNLAGKLDLLGEEAFDEKLIELISRYKKSKYILVFDGRDMMGDKYERENITVIYTPKDSFYKSADDKIVELARIYLNSGEGAKIITDDLEIISKVEKIVNDSGGKISLEKASMFAQKLNSYLENRREENKLADDEIDDINQDLLKAWK